MKQLSLRDSYIHKSTHQQKDLINKTLIVTHEIGDFHQSG